MMMRMNNSNTMPFKMKYIRYHSWRLITCFVLIFLIGGLQISEAQEAKKHRIRLSADYIKIMDSISYINIGASARIDRSTVALSGLDLEILNVTEDDDILLGKVKTDINGDARYTIGKLDKIVADSTQVYNLNVRFKGNDTLKRASRGLEIKDAEIVASHVQIDSVNYIRAVLREIATDSLIEGENMVVQVQRLFLPLRLGEEFNYTDDSGTILVPVEEGIPGVNGILTIEAVLQDHDEYGTVKAIVNAPIGTVIVDESDFDERTMWGGRGKAPWFMLVFPNLIIFTIWGYLIYLIINLYRIKKAS